MFLVCVTVMLTILKTRYTQEKRGFTEEMRQYLLEIQIKRKKQQKLFLEVFLLAYRTTFCKDMRQGAGFLTGSGWLWKGCC